MLIAEEFMLLALAEDTGKKRVWDMSVRPAIAAAILVELIHRERLGVSASDLPRKERERLTLVLDSATEDRILNEALTDAMRFIGKRPGDVITRWNTWGMSRKMQAQVLQRLVDSGVVRRESARVAGIFEVDRFPEVDPAPEQEIRARVNAALLGADPDPRTAVLISLLLATKLLPQVLSPETNRRAAIRRAKQIAEGEWAGGMVKKTLEQIFAGHAVAATASS
ncbi:GOLPH3/VPS74 family protein [Nostocoides veronense]|uniref:GPP34 family phosphoprotein n=1 Tax=Nostocoides veronense TaxID=330836 RepID=A0ABP4XJN2_9MICO